MIPWFTERGCSVANVDYRLAPEALAPAAAEDVRNAVVCVKSKAAAWKSDGGRIILAGFSAGAHLALVAALAPEEIIGGPRSKVLGIVSFWGIPDLVNLLPGGDHARDFARRWMPRDAPPELAKALSPVLYDLSASPRPPLCALHSVHDDVVPFAHSERFVSKYRQSGGTAELVRLTHRDHAAPRRDYATILPRVFGFLSSSGFLS